MPAFSPVTSTKLYIQIYNQIREAILDGTYRVGDKLPSEKEFCEMFGVSRGPVREALSALELNGLVESVHGAGVFVKELSLITNDWVEETDPHDIIQARKLMEPEVARCAALHISEVEKARMRDIVETFRREAESGVYSAQTDRDFHMSIARASGNHVFLVMCDMVWKAMEQRMWKLILSRTVTAAENREQHFKEHMQIAEAILAGDAELAYTVMKAHMEDLERRYWN